jgi:hypothetical protein
MRKFLTLFAVVTLLAAPAFAQLGGTVGGWQTTSTALINAVGSTTTGYYPSATGSTAAKNATSVLFQISAITSPTATIAFEQSVNGAAWTNGATVSFTGTAGSELWACPATPYSRFNMSAHSAGTVSAFLAWRSVAGDPNGTGCHKVNSYGGYTFATGTGTINVATGKAAVFSNGITLAGTDSTTMTFPTTSASVARTDAANTFTGIQTVSTDLAANHFKAVTTVPPTVTGGASTCGTTAAAIVGGDLGGTVTVGSVGGTSCVITFGGTWTNIPACAVNRVGVAAGDLVVTPAATTLTVAGTFGAAAKFTYVCVGYN